MFKIIFLSVAILIVIAIILFLLYINTDAAKLPDDTDAVIKDILAKNDVPEFISGKTGFAQNGDVRIWYEVISDSETTKDTILLVMGHSATAMVWTKNFYQAFVDAGYQVIRYDNRGLGESSWMKGWSKQNSYSLEDMAQDGMAVLDATGVEKAHVIGVSMGGMIAQRMAISHGERVLSLTSIMSSGFMYNKSIPFPTEFTTKLTKLALKYAVFFPTEANVMRFGVGFKQLLKGDGPYQINTRLTAQKTLFELRQRKKYNSKVGDQHTKAISNSGSRLEELKQLRLPTLVIHGTSDPLVKFEHGQKYAPLIPNAATLYIEGMGHDMPDIYMPQYHEAIFRLLETVAV